MITHKGLGRGRTILGRNRGAEHPATMPRGRDAGTALARTGSLAQSIMTLLLSFRPMDSTIVMIDQWATYPGSRSAGHFPLVAVSVA
jgi:hypothetical protein